MSMIDLCGRCGQDKGNRVFRLGLHGMSEEERKIECFNCYRINYIEQEKLFEKNHEGLPESLTIRSRAIRDKRHREAEEIMRDIEENK